MTSRITVEELAPHRIIPVVVADDSEHAQPLATALAAGGIRCAEVTMRTPAAANIIAAMAEVDDFIVGAGTVCNVEQVDAVADAGAQFVVSPGLSASVVRRCEERGLLSLPGVATASEIMAALDLGLTTLKFFPASIVGGPPALKALGGPFQEVRFIPTGGVRATNLADYLALSNVAAVGGTWLTPRELQQGGDWSAITQLTAEACALVGRQDAEASR